MKGFFDLCSSQSLGVLFSGSHFVLVLFLCMFDCLLCPRVVRDESKVVRFSTNFVKLCTKVQLICHSRHSFATQSDQTSYHLVSTSSLQLTLVLH
jgi:hypothetical protein